MSEGPKEKSGSRQSRRRSFVLKTPDVLRHKPFQSQQRSRTKHGSAPSRKGSSRVTSSNSKTNKWYGSGYPALRIADKKIREVRVRQEQQQAKEQSSPFRRSRSYSRGRSVYFNKDDPTIPYYRSKSVDGSRVSSAPFDPVVNEKDVIRLTYTGSVSRENSMSHTSIGSRRGSFSSRRGSGIVQKKVDSVVPHMRGSYTFDDLQTRIYQQIYKIYGEPDTDLKNKQFFLTLAQMQSEHFRMKHMKLTKSDRQFLENMFQEVKNLKKETGKILRNSEHRYSTQFEHPSPVNEKVRRLPRGRQSESFLTKLPRTREKLRLKPIRHRVPHKRGTYYGQYKNYEQYEKYSRQDFNRHSDHFQRAKEGDNPSDMLKFLQQAERLLTAYNQGLLDNSLKGFETEPNRIQEPSQPSKPAKLKPIQHQYHRQSPSEHKQIKHERTSPQKQSSSNTNAEHQPHAPVYKRPESFYDARKHLYFHNRANLVDHQLNEAKNNGSGGPRYSLSTFAK
ncbi:uncharacterized protein LOC128559343 [Mercenaria mercenaria]|uniref:uncharacterized protein LOC128559343 n=1 Tax=Mercenaria mercenaria TaxID=6596 RepID=UPI00234EE2B3|nr:uncharacterized protein LOC128559343 [Mercenaria mercenaria]